MKKFLPPMILCLAAGALGPACGAVSNGGGDPSPTPSPTSALTIADIQQGNVANNTTVTLEGIVVTAVDPFNNNVDFYAQDVGGGQYSGIYFFDGDAVVPAELAVGDEVTVEGTYTEYQGPTSDPWNETISEIRPSSVTITANGLTPTVDLILNTDLGEQLTGTASEPWEFCLVEIDGDVTVLNAALGFGEFSVGNGQAGEQIRVDDSIYSDAEIGRYGSEVITHLAGIWSYSFDEYKLEPRSIFDLVGTTGGIASASVAMVQDTAAGGHPAIGQFVELTSVVVTHKYTSSGETKMYVRDAGTPAIYTGIYIYNANAGNTLVPSTVSTGNIVSLVGAYQEFNGETELVLNSNFNFSFTIENATATDVTPLMVTLAEYALNPEAYEGCLIRFSNATVTQTAAPASGRFTVTDGTYSAVVDDFLYFNAEVGTAMNDMYTEITGIVGYFGGNYLLYPRSPNDITKQ